MTTKIEAPGDENRIGHFEIDWSLIEAAQREPQGKADRALRALMAQVLITRAEFMAHRNCIEYAAYSRLFEPQRKGAMAPFYNITLRPDDEHIKVIAEVA